MMNPDVKPAIKPEANLMFNRGKSIVNFSVKCLRFAPKWSLSCSQSVLAAIFVATATTKVESIPDLCGFMYFDLHLN